MLGSRLGETRRLRVCGPLNTVVNAAWVFDPGSATAYLECAQACGLGLLGGPPTPETALAAHSKGVGQLIAAALRAGAARIVVGLGAAHVPTGEGDDCRAWRPGRGPPTVGRRRGDRRLGCRIPIAGTMGHGQVFAPQKGADMATVAVLEGRLAAWAIELDAAARRGVSAEPGAGAAGGIRAGLLAVGGRYQSGAAIIAEHTHFADDLADAELIVTGEGRFDEQSLHGKVVGAIAAAARPLAIPVIVLAGQVSLDKSALRSAGIMAALSIAEYAGSVRLALADAANQLMGLASQVAARLGNSGPSGYR